MEPSSDDIRRLIRLRQSAYQLAKGIPVLEAFIAATAAPAIAFGLLSWSVTYIPFAFAALPIAVMACPLWFPSWLFSFEQAMAGRTPAAGERLLYAKQVLLRLRERPDGGVQPTPG